MLLLMAKSLVSCNNKGNEANAVKASIFEEIDGGFVAFGGNPSRSVRITDKWLKSSTVSGKDNMYSVDLKNIVPSGGLTYLFSKDTLDESNLWHRRLGHINFKTLNKLVKGNLVRGLPSKIFENNHTCVACQKGKQHKASYYEHQENEDSKVPNTKEPIVNQEQDANVNNTNNINIVSLTVSAADIENIVVDENIVYGCIDDPNMPNLEEIVYSDDDEEVGVEADMNNLATNVPVSPIPTTRVHKDHPLEQIIRDIHSAPQTRRMTKNVTEHVEPKKVIQSLTDLCWIEAMQDELLQFKLQKVWTLVDLPHGNRAIGTKWVYRNKKDDREAIRLFLAYASFKGFIVYQMDVKSAFLYGTIEEEVYVCQPPSFENLQFPDKVCKVEKALYGLHQAPRAWYETLSTYLLENGFRRGTIDKTLFIKKDKGDILLVQVYVDDIIFGSTKKSLCVEFEKIMPKRFQMSSIGELTFFLGLQVKQKDDGIFISQDKYVADILKKFDFATVKTTSTPIETNKALLKDKEAEDVYVHLYRSMIGSLMYLTAFMPNIMFVVCACARDSPFNLEAFSDSDYARASNDRKSTTRDETVYKEWEDRMERAATTACSLEAEQDSGDVEAQIMFEAASKQSNDLPLSRVNTLGSGEDSMKLKELMEHYTQLSELIQALLDKKKVIISETSIRSDLKLDDAKGQICVPTATIFAELERIGYENLTQKITFYKAYFSSQWKFPIHTILQCLSAKTTSWNEFSSTMGSAIICLATNQKFNLSKYIFNNMVKNLDGGGFSGRVTPLFSTIMVQAIEDMVEDSTAPSDSHSTPIISQPLSSKPQKKKSKRKQRKDSAPLEPTTEETTHKAHVSTPSYDPPQSGEDTQAKEIASLKKRVKQLEKRRKLRTLGLKRLRKIGSTSRVESSNDASLGAQEYASKQGRKIDDLDDDSEVTLVDETQEINDENLMFDTGVLEEQEKDVAEKEVSAADPVTTAGEVVTTANVEVTTVNTPTTTINELTLAQT
ncbi:putative ribonuclease H-like domain-containing protein [Tanacetum coccineum]